MCKIASLFQLVLGGCFFCYGALVNGENTAYSSIASVFTCKHKVRVIFTSDPWTSQLDEGDFVSESAEDQVLFGLMGEMATCANESGNQCTMDRSSNELVCCGSEVLDNYRPKGSTYWKEFHKVLSQNVLYVNIAFLVLNLFFLVFIITWGFMHRDNYLESGIPPGQIESIEMS